MKNFNHHLSPIAHLQRGVVLFFALIALVAMSLAAVALIRSVDTNSMIAGNLSFKQSSILSADRGAEVAIAWLSAQTTAGLGNNAAANGYYATMLADAKTLVDASGVAGTIANPDANGNTITYVVQRMCRATGVPTPEQLAQRCSTGPSRNQDDLSNPDQPPQIMSGMVYRITARVVGPKNTVSYIQTFAF